MLFAPSLPAVRRSPALRAAATLLLTALVEVALIVVAYQLYSTVRVLVAGKAATAIANGNAVLSGERALHLSFEQPLQRLALRARWLIDFCDLYYVYMYLPFIGITAVVLFFADRGRYVRVRRAFLISGGIGLLVFAWFPVAPARLLPGAGFVDTVARFYPDAGYASNHFANQYAAVPSFHFGWSLLATCSLWRVARHGLLRTLLAAAPVLMLVTIIVTANHLWFDALAGATVAWLGYHAAPALDRVYAWVRSLREALVAPWRQPQVLGKPVQAASEVRARPELRSGR